MSTSRINANMSSPKKALPRLPERKMKFSDIPAQIMLQEIVQRLVDYDVVSAANLSLTSKSLDFLFKKALISKLLQLMDAVTRIYTPNIQYKIQQITDLIKLRPALMFCYGEARSERNNEQICEIPVEASFRTLDVYFQKMFMELAISIGKKEKYDVMATRELNVSRETLYHYMQGLRKYDEINFYGKTQAFIDEYYSKLTAEQSDNLQKEIDRIICTVIGGAQAELPRWLYDGIVYNSNRQTNKVMQFFPLAKSYNLFMTGEEGLSSPQLNDTLHRSNEKLGETFALICDDNLIVHRGYPDEYISDNFGRLARLVWEEQLKMNFKNTTMEIVIRYEFAKLVDAIAKVKNDEKLLMKKMKNGMKETNLDRFTILASTAQPLFEINKQREAFNELYSKFLQIDNPDDVIQDVLAKKQKNKDKINTARGNIIRLMYTLDKIIGNIPKDLNLEEKCEKEKEKISELRYRF